MAKPKIPRPIGDWTAKKLEHLSAYLDAFALATTKSRERYYIDAMAGCGECVMAKTGHLTLGSAWRALNSRPAFTGIHLVELDRASAGHLRSAMEPYPAVTVYQGDCNEVIPNQVLPKISRVAPTLAFIDPTAAQPGWELLRALSTHRRGVRGEKIELLILFAFDMFMNRWLSHETSWPILDRFYGNDTWRRHLEESHRLAESLDVRRSRFMNLYVDQLKADLGYKFVDVHGPLRKKRRVLYHMIFATDHPVAQKIMNDVWAKARPVPGSLFYERKFEFEP